MESSPYNNRRYAVNDSNHYDRNLWTYDTILYIQKSVAERLLNHPDVQKHITVCDEQIKNVMDSISQSNPHTGTDNVINMIISYITSYIANEYAINKTPEYNKDVLKYDGSQGIQRMPTGQLGIKKKGLNSIGRMF